MERSETGQQWYVMLFPSGEETARLGGRLRDLAGLLGGTPAPEPHVTLGYFQGQAEPAAVVERLRLLDGPAIVIRAAGLFSWTEVPHPLFGYTMSVRVERDAAVQRWQRAVLAALQPLPLRPTIAWEASNPHIQVLRHLPELPATILRRAGYPAWALAFTATRLLVSQRVSDTFPVWLDQPLRPDPTAMSSS
jgi:hypothetical protein